MGWFFNTDKKSLNRRTLYSTDFKKDHELNLYPEVMTTNGSYYMGNTKVGMILRPVTKNSSCKIIYHLHDLTADQLIEVKVVAQLTSNSTASMSVVSNEDTKKKVTILSGATTLSVNVPSADDTGLYNHADLVIDISGCILIKSVKSNEDLKINTYYAFIDEE